MHYSPHLARHDMSSHERYFGNVMLGVLAGLSLWALSGDLFRLAFRDDLSLLGHYGVRQSAYIDYVDIGQ